MLRLPSQLKESASQDPRFAEARAEELRLRRGQANDTLHQIRILLSEKSFTLRKHVHPARAQRYKTRAWSEFHSIEANVHHHAKIYQKAWVAMIKLGASTEDQQKYKVLREEHLKVSTAIVEPNACGQRNTPMSWIWTVDVGRNLEGSQAMTERTSSE